METRPRTPNRGWMSRLVKEIQEESESWPDSLRYQLEATEGETTTSEAPKAEARRGAPPKQSD